MGNILHCRTSHVLQIIYIKHSPHAHIFLSFFFIIFALAKTKLQIQLEKKNQALHSKSETVKSHHFPYKIAPLILFSGAIF